MTLLLSLAGVATIAWPFLIALVVFVCSWLALMYIGLRVGNSATALENFRREAQAVNPELRKKKEK